MVKYLTVLLNLLPWIIAGVLIICFRNPIVLGAGILGFIGWGMFNLRTKATKLVIAKAGILILSLVVSAELGSRDSKKVKALATKLEQIVRDHHDKFGTFPGGREQILSGLTPMELDLLKKCKFQYAAEPKKLKRLMLGLHLPYVYFYDFENNCWTAYESDNGCHPFPG